MYYFDGVTLRQYCLNNNLNYSTIHLRLSKLKREQPHLNDDELVKIALFDYSNINQKYFYKGMLLTLYCKLHPELIYSNIKNVLLAHKKKKGRELTDGEITDIISKYEARVRIKAKIIRFCEENNYEYKRVSQNYYKHKKDLKYRDLSLDDTLDKILNSYCPFAIKYPYKETTLAKYCEENNLSYAALVSYARNRLKSNPTLDLEEVLDEGVSILHRDRVIYYYDGLPLGEYVKLHPELDLNVSSIRGAITRMRAKENKPLQEIVNYCVLNYQKFEGKYFYDGIPLADYCRDNNLDYKLICHAYRTRYVGRSDLTVDEAIKKLVDFYKVNPPIYNKYYFGDTTLYQFCRDNNYSYHAILSRIYVLNKGSNDELITNHTNQAILGYQRNLQFKQIAECFRNLVNLKSKDDIELNNICEFLKIDIKKVCELINMDFDLYQAVSMIWYFYDSLDADDFKTLSDKRLEEIYRLCNVVQNATKEEIECFDLYDLVRLYKTHLYDSRNEILIRQLKYINKVIYSGSKKYDIQLNKNLYEDFKSELEVCLLELFARNFSNDAGSVISYMDKVVKNYFKGYLASLMREYKELYLDKGKYNDSKETLKDNISISDMQIESSEYSEETLKLLHGLDKDKLNFIILRFQEEYTYQEIAEFYGVDVLDVQREEAAILNYLRTKDKKCMLVR